MGCQGSRRCPGYWPSASPRGMLPGVDDKPLVLQFLEWAQKLKDDELRQALEYMNQEYRVRLRRADQLVAMALNVGDWVEMIKPGKRLPAGAKGHVTEIRRERIDVHFPEHGMFTLSAAMVRKTPPPPGGCPK